MPLGTATSKTVEITYFQLTSYQDLVECLNALFGIGYTGHISMGKDLNGNQTWEVLANSATQTAVKAALGDVFVWNGTILDAMSQATFAERYTVT